MFNDLNNSSAAGRPAVDDIFAETDKSVAGANSSDIETHRVGLTSAGETLPPAELTEDEQPASKQKYIKIMIIAAIIIVVLGGAYFTYSQFFKVSSPDNSDLNNISQATNTKKDITPVTPKASDTDFVQTIPAPSTVNPIESVIPTVATSTIIATTTVVESLIDSDSDGLTDIEEKKLGTNINVIDTDNDGLSDYEEVKIYRTDSLNPDTDGDGYLDGAEVKSGYDPNVRGAKLPGNLLK